MVDDTSTRSDRRCLVAEGRHTIGGEIIAGAAQRFDITGCSIDSDLPAGALCNSLRDRRPEAIVLVILLPECLDSTIASNAVRAISMQHD